MGLGSELEHADRFAAYVNELTKVLGHADREKPFRDYCAGLLATEGRRSVEPMAVVTDPGRVSVQHQKLLHLVADSPWSEPLGGAATLAIRSSLIVSFERVQPLGGFLPFGGFGSVLRSMLLGLMLGRPGPPLSRAISLRWAATVLRSSATSANSSSTKSFSSAGDR
jgi:hypothetical protein